MNFSDLLGAKGLTQAQVDARILEVMNYEENSWTGIILDGSLNPDEGQSVVSTNTIFTRIGRIVYLGGEISITDLGSLSGSIVYIGGLPYTAAADGGGLVVTSMTSATIPVMPTGLIDGGTAALLRYPDGFGDMAFVGVSDLSIGTSFKFYGQYRIAA